jgi:hypothetical protein
MYRQYCPLVLIRFPGCKKAFLHMVSRGNLSPPTCEQQTRYLGWDIRRWCTSVLLKRDVDRDIDAVVLGPQAGASDSLMLDAAPDFIVSA